MTLNMPGIHHVTAITGDGQKNIDFYCGVLGLRFVKLTVNFDDPTTYHLYYGDESGRPGSAMTFFAWNGARRGRVGTSQATVTQFAVPADALTYWQERLREFGVSPNEIEERFGESMLRFSDPDGMPLALVAMSEPGGEAPSRGPVPAAYAIRGFHGVTLTEEKAARTEELLTGVMGFTLEGREGTRARYRAGGGSYASIVDVTEAPDAPRGVGGAGTVHHVAFRTPDDAQQKAWQNEIRSRGFDISPVMDRCYFHSIYFREPGGVLFEIATDQPGFTQDEPFDQLGTTLKLPPWIEPHRAELEKVLPPLRLPDWV